MMLIKYNFSFIYILLFILIVYIILRAYIKIKYKFWYIQPVFHIYDIFNWIVSNSIIDLSQPEVNKYTNLIKIKTYNIEEINTILLDRACHFIKSYFLQSSYATYSPQKNNIIEYLKCSNNKSYISIYHEPKLLFESKNQNQDYIMHDELISVITGRPLNITLRTNPCFQIYYVDNLCVHTGYRKKGIAQEMIQTHYYNLRKNNDNIKTCLFKREGELNLIVPLVTYTTYAFKVNDIKKQHMFSDVSNNVIEINNDQLSLFIHFITLQISNKQFDCVIMPDIENIMNLIKTQNIFLYALINTGEIVSLYVFRRPKLFYNKEEAIECFLTLYNKNDITSEYFIDGFFTSLKKISEKLKNNYLLLEETCDSHIIVNKIISMNNNNNISLLFKSPTAFFLYNYCSYTVNAIKSLIFY